MSLRDLAMRALDTEITRLTAKTGSQFRLAAPLLVVLGLAAYCGTLGQVLIAGGWRPTVLMLIALDLLLALPVVCALVLYLRNYTVRDNTLKQLHLARDSVVRLFWLHTTNPEVESWRRDLVEEILHGQGLELPAQVQAPRPTLTVLSGGKR